MLLKLSTLSSLLIFSFINLPAQVYNINLDTDRDGIMNEDDQDPVNRNIPFDSIFNYNNCFGEEASIDLEIVFPGLVMKWDTCTAFEGNIGYGKRFIPKSQVKCYSTLYDTVTQTIIRRLVHFINVGDEDLKLIK